MSSQLLRKAPKDESLPASKVLSHPTRVRILEVVNEQDMSPIQFVNNGLTPGQTSSDSLDPLLAHVSYHFRELAKYGCVKVVRTAQRRGATEHVYRGAARAVFTDAEWAKLDLSMRQRISRTVLQGLVARAESAMMAAQFDSRLDRHLSWIPIKNLDERGWTQLQSILATTFEDVEQIRSDSEERLRESDESAISATVGILLFESPPSQPGASLIYEEDT